jgi:hypothetical protein
MTDYITDAQNDVKSYFETYDIPNYFYQHFFAELIKIFGVQRFIPSDNNERSYKDWIDYHLTALSGSFGWVDAFTQSCKQCELRWLSRDYNRMDWVKSDIFEGYIVDKMVEALFDENYPRGYCERKYMA